MPGVSTYDAVQICGATSIHGLTHSPNGVAGLRGWARFSIPGYLAGDEEATQVLEQKIHLYKRWWNLRGSGYVHPLLLWIQRDYVFREFEKVPVQPGQAEDTPYDYDHICPESHWKYWTGAGQGNRIIEAGFQNDPHDKSGNYILGNSIGNVRVWNSSRN